MDSRYRQPPAKQLLHPPGRTVRDPCSGVSHADVFAEAPAAACASVSVVLHFKLQGDAEPQRHVLQCGAGLAMDMHPASAERADLFAAATVAFEEQHGLGFIYVESAAFELLA